MFKLRCHMMAFSVGSVFGVTKADSMRIPRSIAPNPYAIQYISIACGIKLTLIQRN